MLAYTYGVFDILRGKDLNEIDRKLELSRENGAKYFGVGVYDANLCQVLGMSEPLKSIEDRMKIMQQIIGVDFVFPITSLDENIIKQSAKTAYSDFMQAQKESEKEAKKYEIGYAPGTWDLFHAGHLENLMIASESCEKLIVGVKSNELVESHKHKKPFISDDERMEILRHFKFVYDVHKYHTRELEIANQWIKGKYGKGIQAVFLGSDLKKDFSNVEGINIIYTPRNPEQMKTRSTTAYGKKLHLIDLEPNERFTGPKGQVQQIVENNDKNSVTQINGEGSQERI